MNKILIFIMIFSAFIACEDVNEKHEQYLREGSPIYAGKIDSLDCYSGFYRVKASIYPSIDVNRHKVRVYWNNFNDSTVFSYDDMYLNPNTGRYEVIIDGFDQTLVEGFTTLTFVNYDLQGNKSKETERTVLIYGADYTSSMLNQVFTGYEGEFMNFGDRNGAVGLLVKYFTNAGTEKTIEFKGPVETLKVLGLDPNLPDLKRDTKIKYKTLYRINKTDIDSIYPDNFSETVTLNVYHGAYLSTGNVTHPNPAYWTWENLEKYYISIDENTIEGSLADNWPGGGSWKKRITINPDNSISIVPAGSSSGSLELIPGEPNNYDPATKTITVNYRYLGGSGYRFIREVLVFKN